MGAAAIRALTSPRVVRLRCQIRLAASPWSGCATPTLTRRNSAFGSLQESRSFTSPSAREVAFHVAFMLHGVADNKWQALKIHVNFCNTMQHEKASKSMRERDYVFHIVR